MLLLLVVLLLLLVVVVVVVTCCCYSFWVLVVVVTCCSCCCRCCCLCFFLWELFLHLSPYIYYLTFVWVFFLLFFYIKTYECCYCLNSSCFIISQFNFNRKQADTYWSQGKYKEAASQLAGCLSSLGRPLPVSRLDQALALIWQTFRQLLHRIYIGRWMTGRMKLRDPDARNCFR